MERRPMGLVIDVGGLGYEIQAPWSTLEVLPPTGQKIKLYTHLIIREDAHTLYGFYTHTARDLFRLIVEKVSGFGPKLTLGLLSHMSPQVLEQIIAQGNLDLLTKCPGIGQKTAQRLILELQQQFQTRRSTIIPSLKSASKKSTSKKSKNTTEAPNTTLLENEQKSTKDNQDATPLAISGSFSMSDALSALTALGYTLAQANQAVQRSLEMIGEPPSTEALIRQALKF